MSSDDKTNFVKMLNEMNAKCSCDKNQKVLDDPKIRNAFAMFLQEWNKCPEEEKTLPEMTYEFSMDITRRKATPETKKAFEMFLQEWEKI